MRLVFLFFLIAYNTNALRSEEINLSRKSYPLNPQDSSNSEASYSEPILTPKSGLSELIKQKQQLEKALKLFPPHESYTSPPRDKFGYMSRQLTVTEPRRPINEWVELRFQSTDPAQFASIALIPSFFPELNPNSSFAFPKRFKIDVFPEKNSDKVVTIVDWTQQDFPDPGLYPVIFAFPDIKAYKVRLTVTKGAILNKKEFFTLDEMVVFRSGTNKAAPVESNVGFSDRTRTIPFWTPSYLLDRRIHLGSYQQTAASTPVPDFTEYFDNQLPAGKPCEIIIDLGSIQSIGRVELFAAKNPDPAAPHYPLPIRCKVGLLKSLSDKKNIRKHTKLGQKNDNILWYPLYSRNGRYIKIIVESLPQSEDRHVLAIGEIRVIGDEAANIGNIAVGKPVILKNFPERARENAALLVDGHSKGRKIMNVKVYFEQLAKRRLVEQALIKVNKELTISKAIRKERWLTVLIISSISIVFGLILLFIRQKHEKREAVHEVQQQISADLHDDISGNLGTISMISGNLPNIKNPELLDKKFNEIYHLAQESFLSLKEIIWHTGGDSIRYSDLFRQIERTARGILTTSKVDCQFPTTFDDLEVPFKIRRNIILLTKESLYNCAKYADAENITISATIQDSRLELQIQDNGRGFDPSGKIVKTQQGGRGLENMKRRAKMLGAQFSIDSAPGKGTTTTIKMPIQSK